MLEILPRRTTHLGSLEIKDFKSLKQVSIELGQMNVFVGANGAGKSNLLEAVGILGACASGVVDDQSLARRGVRPGVPEVYKSSFHGEKMERLSSLMADVAHQAMEHRDRHRLRNPARRRRAHLCVHATGRR